jgi:hypothetical protein
MGDMSPPTEKAWESPIRLEVEMIMSDLMVAADARLGITWESRPLRDDDDYWEYPKYLDDGSPRFVVVTLSIPGDGSRFMVADALNPPGMRDYFIAEAVQDDICDALHELRPLCPVHSGPTPRILVPSNESDGMYWQCNEDPNVRCALGSYWPWRSNLERQSEP